jgi:hypothetical protein
MNLTISEVFSPCNILKSIILSGRQKYNLRRLPARRAPFVLAVGVSARSSSF